MNWSVFDAKCWKQNYKPYLLATGIHVDVNEEPANPSTREERCAEGNDACTTLLSEINGTLACTR